MYGGNGAGPIAGGTSASVLAYTGTGSMLLPLIVAAIALSIGLALLLRKRVLTQADAPIA